MNRKGENGIAVLLSLFYTLLVLGLVLTSISGHRVSKEPKTRSQAHQGDLLYLTEAGLTRTLHQLRRARTLDRVVESHWSLSYSMAGKLWGSVDVTLDRKSLLLMAEARVHERSDPDQDLDTYPNRILARARSQVSLGRMCFRPPAKAPLVLARPSLLHLDSDLVLLTRKGEATLAYIADGEELPDLPEGSLAMELPPERLDIGQLLGIPLEDLAAMSDRHVPAGESLLEIRWELIHVRGERRLDADDPLRGSGFLVVEGDLLLEGDVQHEFQGILLVTGSLTVRGRARIEGMTIVMGGLRLEGSGADAGLTLQFDEESLRRALWNVDGIRFFNRPQMVMESLEQPKTMPSKAVETETVEAKR